MKGFPKNIATGKDLYNCLSLVQAGELPANDLSDAIAAIEEREYITVPVLEISADRKTVVINPCAEALTGAKIKNNYTTTIKEARLAAAKYVLEAMKKIAEHVFDRLDDLFSSLGFDLDKLIPGRGDDDGEENDGGTEAAELMMVTLSRAMKEGETVLKILAEKSPYDVLGISADEIKSIKGVLKNYALSDK